MTAASRALSRRWAATAAVLAVLLAAGSCGRQPGDLGPGPGPSHGPGKSYRQWR